MDTTDILYLTEYNVGNGLERGYATPDSLSDDETVIAALPAYRGFVLDKVACIETIDDSRRMIDAWLDRA